MKHDQYFIDIAKYISERSKDVSTKTGAVIVADTGEIVSTGFNGFPRGMSDDFSLYYNREEKLSRIIHCEMNALIFAQRSVRNATLYTWPFMSCDRCVVHMLQAGITRFVAPFSDNPRWQESFERTRKYIKECNATLLEIK